MNNSVVDFSLIREKAKVMEVGSAGVSRHNNLPGIQAPNSKVVKSSVNLYIGEVADPYKICGFLAKSLSKMLWEQSVQVTLCKIR